MWQDIAASVEADGYADDSIATHVLGEHLRGTFDPDVFDSSAPNGVALGDFEIFR
jgi:hypothetical protein